MPAETVQVVIQKLPDVVTYGIAALVVIGLIGLILLGKMLSKMGQGGAAAAQETVPAAPAAAAVNAPAVANAQTIPNRGELVAAISAALAEELGTEVSAIRIHSIKRVG